ncbi:MAG: hypothetical protein ACOYN4_06105, partial [Bacteroidales bacterium]
MKKLITIIFLLTTGIAFAQKVRVISKTDLQPISSCSIYNVDKTVSVTTDNKGLADISTFKNSDKLTFSHISFYPVEFEKSMFTAKITDIQLTVAVINLQEVVLSANKVEEKYRDLPVRVDIIPVRTIMFGNPQTTGELLQQNGTA